MRKLMSVLALVAVSSPVFGQQVMKDKDPDNKVAGGGTFPAGWVARLDRPDRAKMEDVKFVSMGPGYHATMGPAAIFWNTKNMAPSGPFIAKASFTQTKAPSHPEAYGLIVGGKNLDQPNQEYVYFIVRGDGKYMINHRAGTEVHKIVDWTENAAINKADEAGKATNELSVKSTPDSIVFMANGKSVHAMDRSHAGMVATDGQIGLRVNHNLDVHIGSFDVTPIKK